MDRRKKTPFAAASPPQRAIFIGVLILLVAAALRLPAVGQVPPGLYHDEAYYGLDAVDVLQGHLQIYFPANNGREPLFIYLAAAMIGLLGRSPFALRLTSAFVGLLTVAATAAAGRALFSRRVGLLAAAILAVTLWHVHLSRVGFRAVTLPLMLALTVWFGARAVRTSRPRLWLAAGALYGLSFYTYTAARFTPVALGAFGLYALAAFGPRAFRSHARGIGLAVLAAAVALAPLAAYTVSHPCLLYTS
ncbi:MAG: glycosyltransferase family 39 protein, partial [Anaerolineae bacterium]|nr:glycosyltransferase family 39 protein [Anaerolineae bacterium]